MGRLGIALAVLALTVLAMSSGWCGTVAQARSAPVSAEVDFTAIVISVDQTECYVEASDRSAGIRVFCDTAGLTAGDVVTVTGTRGIVDGEPTIVLASAVGTGKTGQVRPFGMRVEAVGGGGNWAGMRIWDYRLVKVQTETGWEWERRWLPSSGACNTGSLVTTWSTVNAVYYSPETGAKWFYVDDGSKPVSDLGDRGVLVYSDKDVTIGDFISVTGVSSTDISLEDPTRLVRVMRTRSAEDVSVVRESQVGKPFSDEFDSPVIDLRWVWQAGAGEIDLTADPGWLLLAPTSLAQSANAPYNCWVAQYVASDWDMEFKMLVDLPADSPYSTQDVGVALPGYARTTDGGVFFRVRRLAGGGLTATLVQSTIADQTGDTFYFRGRKRGTVVYGSMSTDGVTYTDEHQSDGVTWLSGAVYLYAGGTQTGSPYRTPRVHFDYFRITPVTGGQQ